MSLRQRVLRRLALLVASTGLAACTLRPEPLRAGWLRSGVYAQPPPPACAPPKAPGVAFEELSRWSLPSFDARVAAQLTLPWVGPFTATVQGAGAEGPRHRVSSRSIQPMRIVEDRAVAAQVPGHVAGVDLRSYRRIAFIADTSGWRRASVKLRGASSIVVVSFSR